MGYRVIAGNTSGAAVTVSVGPDFGNPPELEVGAQVAVASLAGAKTWEQSVGCSFANTFNAAVFVAQSVGAHLAGTALGAPLFQNVSTVESTTSGTSVVLPKPTDLAVGDLMVAVIGMGGLLTTTLPTGWTLILNTQRNGSSDVTLNSSWKIADADDVAASSFTFTISASNGFFGTMFRITAFNSSAPINISGGGSGSATDPVAPSITTTVNNCLKICACVQANSVSITYTPPSGYTERSDLNGLGALGAHGFDGETATAAQATAGASGTATMDSTQAIASDYAAQHIAIAPGTITLAS